MKRTNTVTKVVAVMLFLAMAAYIGFYAISAISGGYRTAPAVLVEIDRSVQLTGIIIRDELCIESEEQYLSVSAKTGKKLAVGDTIATAYSSEEALARAGEIHELELQKEYIQSVLSGSSTETVAKKDSSIKLAISRLSAAATRHKTDELASAGLNLSALVLSQSAISATQADLNTVQNKISSLKQSAARDTKTLTATESGLFCSSADGYEYLTLGQVEGISASALEKLTKTPQEVAPSVRGKMVYGNAWYYAATVPAEQAELLVKGDWVSLDFGRYCSDPINALIISVTQPENGQCVAIFRCAKAMSEMLTVRFADAQIVRETTTGLRVPKAACYSQTDDDGNITHYVFISEGGRASKKLVTITQDMGDYYLAEVSSSEDYLRADNDILVTSKTITDGMLLE